MNKDNLSEFLTICRTCLHKEANNPIFADKTNAASYSEMVFIVTGVKVEMDDTLPQNLCENCLNNINHSLNFRKQCKEAETQLLIMKNKVENNKHNEEIKLEIASEIIHNKKSQQNIIASITLDTKIKDDSIQIQTKEKYLDGKNSHMKTDLMKVLINVTDRDKQKDNYEIKTVLCELCKKTIMAKKYHTHMIRKHNPTVGRNVMCNICSIYFSKKQLNKHFNSTHIKSTLNKSNNNNSTMNKSFNSQINNTRVEREKRKERKEIISHDKLNAFPNRNSLLNESLNLDNENICSEKQNNDTVINKSLTAQVESPCNDEQLKTESIETVPMENILYNFNDTVSKRVTCKLCQKDLSIRSIDSHMARHHPGADKRRVKCDLCDNYVLKSKLNRHTALMHNSGFLCRYCKSNYDNKEELVEHISHCTQKKKRRICESSRELRECDECNKTMQRGSLKLHKAIAHAGLRPACKHCGKTFGNKLRLQDHYRAKHGYEKFKCSSCDFQSACAMSMRNHERRHRGEKPFLCEACGAEFHAAYLLAQHRQSHAAGKEFQCDICPAAFKVNNTLHMHKRSCHGTSKYACTICARTFRTRHYVVKHMRAVHRFTGPVPPMQPIE